MCFVPNWAGHGKRRADYRFLAMREPLRQLDLGDADQLPFPTEEFASKGRYKLFGVVTNRGVFEHVVTSSGLKNPTGR